MNTSALRLIENQLYQPVAVHPKSLAFFAALNSCLSVDKLPHPIRTRNADLLATWLEWRCWLAAANHSIVDDAFLDDPTCGFEPCIDGLVQAIKSDPEWQRGSYGFIDMTTITVLAAASLVLWRNRHRVIELTDALQDLLSKSDLGADIPIDYLRPPVPACYINLGNILASSVVLPANHKNFGTCILEGVYVFESEIDNKRRISLTPVYRVKEAQLALANTIDIVINDEKQSLIEVIKEVCSGHHADDQPHFESVMQACAMLFFYQSLKPEQCQLKQPYTEAVTQLKRLGPKKVAKRYRQLAELYDRFVIGPQALSLTTGEVSPHLRRGHFRLQPCGPHASQRRVMFIAPTWVRADRL